MTIIVYVHMSLGRAYFKTKGVKKNSVPYMIEIVFTNVPIESGIVHPYVGQALVLPPFNMTKVLSTNLNQYLGGWRQSR